MAVFFALELPLQISNVIETTIDHLKTHYSKKLFRWTPIHKCHVTLVYLSTISDKHLQQLSEAVKEKLSLMSSFYIDLTTLELFPSEYQPYIISIRVAGDPLKEIVKVINENVERLGYPVDKRPFRGHITLARLKQKGRVFKLPKEIVFPAQSMRVEKITLLRSEHIEREQVYTPIEVFLLNC